MFSVPQLEALKQVGLPHAHGVGAVRPAVPLVLDPVQPVRTVRARAAARFAALHSWRDQAIRGCAYLPEVALYVVVGSVLVWAPAAGTQALVVLPVVMLLVLGVPWLRGTMFPERLQSGSLPGVSGPEEASARSRVDSPGSAGRPVRRALHRDARFGA